MSDVRTSHLQIRLSFRLAAALCLGAAAILVCAGIWNVSLQREHMTELVQASADRVADVVLRSTRAAMLDNEPAQVQRIIDTVGAQRGIERIRIFDKLGRIGKSTRSAEVGTIVDKRAEQCFVCHREDRPLERLEGSARVRTFSVGGSRVLGVILPIRNEPDCASAACHAHPPDQAVLGVLDVHLSLAAVDDRILRSERQMAVGLGVTVAAMLVLSGGLMWFLVLRPLRRLRVATERVAAGDLAARLPDDSGDEFGDVGRAWNAMISEIARSRDELERWSLTLEARVDVATRELEAAHRRMLLVEKMASLGKLAAVVAHEINNPLAGIATFARLLKRQYERRAAEGGTTTDAETLRALDLVETEAMRCGNIVRNLLLFSRAAGSRFADEDVGPILDRCATLVRHQAELKSVTMTTDVAADLPKVECDASQLQQVILALAMNAIEAMPDGGTLALRARRATQAEDAGVEIDVTDTGCGIPADVLPHVFEPFFTTKDHGSGVGLGLAVVYGIVERHHGSVDVRTQVGAGTTFTVRLPRRQPPSPPPAPAPSSAPASATGSPADASPSDASSGGRAPPASPAVSEGTVP